MKYYVKIADIDIDKEKLMKISVVNPVPVYLHPGDENRKSPIGKATINTDNFKADIELNASNERVKALINYLESNNHPVSCGVINEKEKTIKITSLAIE